MTELSGRDPKSKSPSYQAVQALVYFIRTVFYYLRRANSALNLHMSHISETHAGCEHVLLK